MAKKKSTRHKKEKKTARKKPHAKKVSTGKRAVKNAPPKRAKKRTQKAGSRAEARIADYTRAARIYKKYRAELEALEKLRDEDGKQIVKGSSPGEQEVGGKPTGKMAIRIHVSSKAYKKMLRRGVDYYGLREEYDGVPSDIRVWRFRNAGTSFPDGECIAAQLKGTLGTSIFITGVAIPRWLTAAHIVSKSVIPPTSDRNVRLCSTSAKIGTVHPSLYFRDEEVDAALVEPDFSATGKRTWRIPYKVRPADINKQVSIIGAVSGKRKGRIASENFRETLTSGETVVNHIQVKNVGSNAFAQSGDSGAVVSIGNQPIGILRAVSADRSYSIVSRFELVRKRLPEFDL